MKTYTTGFFSEGIDPATQQRIENAYLAAKPKVIETYREHYGRDAIVDGGACLYWAVFGCKALEEAGFQKTILQAGSMHWVTAPTPQAGQVNRFGYEFGPSLHSAKQLAGGGIPEMHVWIALLDTGILIDFATEGFYGQYNALREAAIEQGLGHMMPAWDSEKPPKYFVAKAGEAIETYPHTCNYHGEPLATVIAVKAARGLLVSRGLVECPEGMKVPAKLEPYVENSYDMFMALCEKRAATDANYGKAKAGEIVMVQR